MGFVFAYKHQIDWLIPTMNYSLMLEKTIYKIFTQDDLEQQHYYIKYFYTQLQILGAEAR